MEKYLLQRILTSSGEKSFQDPLISHKELHDIFYKIAEFDNMGANEYEFDSIPKALFCIKQDKTKKLFFEEINGKGFWFIASPENREKLSIRIRNWSLSDNYDYHNEYHGLKDYIENKENIDFLKLIGWLDINEPSLFFIHSSLGGIVAEKFFEILK